MTSTDCQITYKDDRLEIECDGSPVGTTVKFDGKKLASVAKITITIDPEEGLAHVVLDLLARKAGTWTHFETVKQ